MRARKRGARLALVHGADVLEDVHAERQSLGYQAHAPLPRAAISSSA